MLGLSWRLFTIIAIVSGLTWTIKRYQEQQKQQQDYLNVIFYQFIQENQGHITALDLAIKSQLSGKVVQEFLDQRAKEFGAELEITEQGGLLYYFPTAVSLISNQVNEELGITANQIFKNDTLSVSEQIIEKDNQTLGKHSQVNSHLNLEQEDEVNYNQIISLSLTQKELADRLNVHSSTISKRKTKPDFGQWSSQKDPELISWRYIKEQAIFLPITD
ncbi:MAG: hypothetical protein AB4080_19315 [Trichodesmium sp.]